MTRIALSRPVATALDDGVLRPGFRVLDYGCGRGGDVARLRRRGIPAVGWDPAFSPEVPLKSAELVNLGYVLNVIEDTAERDRTLLHAWSLAERVLIVSVRLKHEAQPLQADAHSDGLLTSSGTFQKFYAAEELRTYVEKTLGHPTITAAPGILYVFRHTEDEHAFLAGRVRSRMRLARSPVLFAEHEGLLAPLVAFVEEHGRLPRREEKAGFSVLEQELGTVKRAFSIVRRVTGDERWDRVRVARTNDLLVYLALTRFTRRPRFSELSVRLQHDIKDFFGSLRSACDQADRLLAAIADERRVAAALNRAAVGKRTQDSLYVHVSVVPRLVPLLRVLDGTARVLLGAVEETSLVKFRRDRASLSYLAYGAFDAEGHPQLTSAYTVDLQTLRADFHDYGDHVNPPVLHRKELFVADDYPRRADFARLTADEVRAGLFDEPTRIGTLAGWREQLDTRGLEVKGHRLIRVKEQRAGND